ncbi:hypothetical protein VQL36_20320 [Chengkuizengella sp. SCS-71B]
MEGSIKKKQIRFIKRQKKKHRTYFKKLYSEGRFRELEKKLDQVVNNSNK